MRNTSFLRRLTLLCGVMVLFSCRNTKVTLAVPKPEFSLSATAQRYVAALGKGRGVLFHIHFIQPDSIDVRAFMLDSLVINGQTIPSSLRTGMSKLQIEGNYFVPLSDPEPGVIPIPTTASPDPILFLSEYLPATLYFHYKQKPYSTPIHHFESISE